MSQLLGLSGLSRVYGALRAVDGVDLSLAAGARHALIGPNGAGKTTLLHLVAGTIRPSAGRVLLAGRDVTRAGPARRNRLGIGRTFQHPAVLPSLSVLDNVVLGGWHRGGLPRWPGTRQRLLSRQALEWLDRIGLADLADQPAGSLSHGQRRLLDTAVALAGSPRLLLLDEPAAGLTDKDTERLLAVLTDLPADLALLLVEHDLAFVAALADTATVLAAGRVLATGAPREVWELPSVRQAYWGVSE